MAENNLGITVSEENLTTYGENIARGLHIDGAVSGARIAKTILSALRSLHTITDRLTAEYSGAKKPSEAAEWLLDNWYLAQREGLGAAQELRGERRLRSANGKAVLLELADALVRSGHGKVTESRLELFLTGFQRALVLSRRELGLLIPAVRAALALQLADAAKRPLDAENAGRFMGRFISSLRLLGSLDLSELLEKVDHSEQILRRDPSGVYPLMDEKTRDSYRLRVSKLAKRYKTFEHLIAQRVLRLSESARGPGRHVGYYLFVKPLGDSAKPSKGGGYISANVLLSLFFALLIGFLLSSPLAALFLLFPVSELVKSGIDFFCLRTTPPRHIPRLELCGGIPEQGRTLCVISALLTSSETGKHLASRLEEFRLSNRDAGANLLFGILADLPETKDLGDGAEDWIAPAVEAVEALNKKYGGGFYLFCRDRAPCGKVYRGWERKRGAILSLMRLIRTGNNEQLTMNNEARKLVGMQIRAGSALGLRGVRYLLTLDADTALSPGSARELVGAMLHPLNAPVIERRAGGVAPYDRVVTAGRAVIHPRIATELEAATKTGFSRLFAGQGGLDPYGGAAGEVTMDLFDRGGFAGKGILDIDAFLSCMEGRVPENAVLSHDALEGAYLRGGYMSDVELSDGFPGTVSGYYKRAHRWVRGDWQNAPWLFKRGRELSDIDRFRLFDSLRRSLIPPFTFLALLGGFLLPSLAWAAAAALLCFASELLLAVADSILRPEKGSRVRYHSAVIHGVGGAILRTAVRLLLLPYEAWVCASAIFLALWRMLVTHKNLLSWQTAAQTETVKQPLLRLIGAMWLPVLTGILLSCFAPSIAGRAAGILWALSPLFAYSLSLPKKRRFRVSGDDRQYLLKNAAEIWRYFEQNCRAEDHFLPPDNFQEQPPVGLAHRTSPTNMGLCLLSALAALDLELCSKQSALGVAENLLSTMERMPLWHGHFYNWYDTRSLKPLHPAYVSTVDSGNLACCLVALREGLTEFGEDMLAARADTLLSAMDFSPLYDRRRRLFHIGLDTDSGKASEGWYDLLASEARLTGFYAIAKGDVERRHWRRLSRVLTQKDGYRGMASWTGTMFEYLMPELLMPCYRHSLLYESAKFCLYVQKRRSSECGTARYGHRAPQPWGISESAYFSLDGSLSYRYKAHGCGALALKRGMDRELVVSPYSSFLALAVDPRGVIKNLQKLEEYGARGRFGFWEAVDYTPARLVDGKPQVVRCAMAHHLGMSLLSVANLLCDGSIQKRFMRDPAMRAHAGLLQEKVPVGGVLLRKQALEPPEKPRRAAAEPWSTAGEGINFERPARSLLSNGVYNIMLTSNGETSAHAGEILIYRSPDEFEEGARLHVRRGEALTPLLPERQGNTETAFSWVLGAKTCTVTGISPRLKSSCSVSIPAARSGELRRVTLEALGEAQALELCFSFAPALCKDSDYRSHPAFYGLGIQTSLKDGTLLIRRLARGKLPELWLCLACDRPMTADCSGAPFHRRSGTRDISLGWQKACSVTASAALTLSPSAPVSVRFALALGADAEEAYAGAQCILMLSEDDLGDLPSGAAAILGMGFREVTESMKLLSAILAKTPERKPQSESAEGREGLWRFGVSGDFPILCAELCGSDYANFIQRLIRRHALLTDCGFRFDLVFLTDEGGDYHRPRFSAVWETLRGLGREWSAGARGGVHCADHSLGADTLQARAALTLHTDTALPDYTADKNIMSTNIAHIPQKFPEYRWSENNGFEFYVNYSLPPRAWGMMLTNGDFGFFATDCGTGHMWLKNAREGLLSRWDGDPYAVGGTESLTLTLHGECRSLFAEPGDTDCVVRYAPGCATWEKTVAGIRVKTTAFVPDGVCARVLLIECGDPDAQVAWHCSLALPGGNPDFHILQERRTLVCGCGEVDKLRALTNPDTARVALLATCAKWQNLCGKLKISTPSEALNRYINGWSVYQTLACRILGRSSIYQSGGAFGFRDQIQDAVNLTAVSPSLARAQILSCAAHQYEEGDVLHWWHNSEAGCKGVRTRCSDDLLWLPWALCEYLEKTGDRSVLGERVPYLQSEPLGEREGDRYESPEPSERAEDVLSHCKRALDLILSRGGGEHGLLLMGAGDWNDGFDRVGKEGKGESVWLSWFFAHTAARFGELLRQIGDPEAPRFAEVSRQIGQAANNAWDGAWYLRGTFDDGQLLGSAKEACCQIDSISQSFSAFCKEASPERRLLALDSALDRLFERERGIVRLFDPPFADTGSKPGYIESYGPGFRENGGQYTHAAIWLGMALLKEGRTDEGLEILEALLPENHDPKIYGAEPFVLAADVYTAPGQEGVAGWSWYTGSSGWYFRVVMEYLLGLRPRNGRLYIEPKLPSAWPGYEATWRDGVGTEYTIAVSREGILVNGQSYDEKGLAM